jgi:hypothetical protein
VSVTTVRGVRLKSPEKSDCGGRAGVAPLLSSGDTVRDDDDGTREKEEWLLLGVVKRLLVVLKLSTDLTSSAARIMSTTGLMTRRFTSISFWIRSLSSSASRSR